MEGADADADAAAAGVDWETVEGSAVIRSMRVVPAADSEPDAMALEQSKPEAFSSSSSYLIR